MKIYQLHEYDYSYGECFHSIKGSYLRKERAEEEKTKAEWKEKELVEKNEKCFNCPFIEEEYTVENINNLIAEYPNYCNEMKLSEGYYGEGYYGIECDNYFTDYEERSFEIKEVEVEE